MTERGLERLRAVLERVDEGCPLWIWSSEWNVLETCEESSVARMCGLVAGGGSV